MSSGLWHRIGRLVAAGRSARRRGGARKSRRPRGSAMLVAEQLESRRVLDARVLITEVVSDNEQGLEDEDNEPSDWLELYNAGDTAADLTGWHLTDDASDRTKWTFPAVTIQPEQYLVVFASGKNRRDPAGPLHTNFQFDRDGEYVGLFNADASAVVSEFANGLPALQSDRSYGLAQNVLNVQLIDANSAVRVLIPTAANGGDTLGLAWTDPAFDDSPWTSGTGGVGFEQGSGFETLIGTDVEAAMVNVNTTAYIRIPFTIGNPHAALSMLLRTQYDDGYVAYLNGVAVDRRNAPAELAWNSEATTNHRDTQAKLYEDSDLSAYTGLLRQGTNVLAIHGMNSTLTSDDFLIGVELQIEVPDAIQSEAPRFFEWPTPGFPNGSVTYGGLAESIDISVTRGFYDQPFDVMLSSSTPGASLVYTTDGSPPSADNGTVVAAADASSGVSITLQVTETTTLRAAAVKDDYLTSRINTQSYIILSDVLTQDFQATLDAGFPETWNRVPADYGMDSKVIGPDDQFDGEFAAQIIDALKAAPSVSIVMNRDDLFGPEGIYVNSTRTGFDWERPTSFEFLEADGSGNVQADGGIRIAGDNVRNFGNSKKMSLRLEFRQRYGPTKLRYPLFGPDGTDSFDTIILRGGYNDAWVHTPTTTQYIRDQWARETLLAMGRPQAHGRFVHVYLNGFYWGVYVMVERPNASFSASYSGGDKDEWDTLNTGNVRDGTRDAWADLLSLSRAVNDADQQQSNAALLRLLGKNPDATDNPAQETLIDVDNYIDYLIVNFYGGNVDWPGRNYYVGRLRGPESTGFQFYAWDTEKILDHGEGSDLNTNRTTVTDGVAAPFGALRVNQEFRLLFADHVHRHFFNGGVLYVNPDSPAWDPAQPQNNRPAASYYETAGRIELPLIGESARWGDTQTSGTRTDRRTFTLREWRAMRDRLFDRYFPRRSDIVLQQFVQAGLYPQIAAPVFSQHGGVIQTGFQLTVSAPGDVYYTLDGSDPRQSALQAGTTPGAVSPSALKYEGPITLDGGAVVKSRTLVDGQWSALNEATFSPLAPSLRISEIMYHPRDPQAGGTLEDDDFEFIELVNIDPVATVDLEGVAFTDGVGFVFPQRSLAPGERVVVVRNQAAFEQRYGAGVNVAGQYGGTADDFKLSNGGETLTLVDRFGTLIQEFTYSDAWIPSTDGSGYSLTAVDLNAAEDAWNSSNNWRSSVQLDGSPGTDDAVDFTGDGRLDGADVDAFCGGLRSGDVRFDLTGDAVVDQADLTFLIQNLLGTTFGDADLNRVFNSADLVAVLAAGEYEDQIAGNSTWAEGDWDCDGDFTTQDFVTALAAGGYSAGVVAEPLSSATSRWPDEVAGADLNGQTLQGWRDVEMADRQQTEVTASERVGKRRDVVPKQPAPGTGKCWEEFAQKNTILNVCSAEGSEQLPLLRALCASAGNKNSSA